MKQKLGLCCALVHDPDLLILDEPTTGVDPLSRRQFWELIGRIRVQRPGMTLLVATAYMEEAERFGHIVAIDEGKIIEDGSARADVTIEPRFHGLTGLRDFGRADEFVQAGRDAVLVSTAEIKALLPWAN